MKQTLTLVLSFLFPILGLTAGLAASYLFSPAFMGVRAFTFAEWFSKYPEIPRAGTTIAVCAFVGITLGVFTSAVVARGGTTQRSGFRSH